MLVSVIICTYKRFDAVTRLLGCLRAQTHKQFEVLVVDGSGDAGSALRTFVEGLKPQPRVEFLASAKGLPLQRNVGLDRAKGELIMFFDDDVTFAPDFIERTVELFARSDMKTAGGATAYDTRNHPQPISWRWRLRAGLRIAPQLTPGAIDRLGRSIPIGFAKPFHGLLDIGYMAGFCMLYRATAIKGLRFDESIPTYGGEDRDFSARVGKSSRLVLCGDLPIEHHCAPQSRDSDVQRTFQAGFGIGLGFAKNATQMLDYLELARVIICEFLVDSVACAYKPTRQKLLMPFARTAGFFQGLRSFRASTGGTV